MLYRTNLPAPYGIPLPYMGLGVLCGTPMGL